MIDNNKNTICIFVRKVIVESIFFYFNCKIKRFKTTLCMLEADRKQY